MLKWLLRGKLSKVAESDITDARLMLSATKLKLHKEGAEATLAYAEGLGEVAGLLARRFRISVPDALVARCLSAEQLDDASRDLVAAAGKARSILHSEVQAARSVAHKQAFGCLMLYHLYRLRFLAQRAPQPQQASAAEVADRLAEFSSLMAEIAIGFRDPSEAHA